MKANMREVKSKHVILEGFAVNGERVVIAKAGKPFEELISCRAEPRPAFGWLKDQMIVGSDFDSDEVSATVVAPFDGIV